MTTPFTPHFQMPQRAKGRSPGRRGEIIENLAVHSDRYTIQGATANVTVRPMMRLVASSESVALIAVHRTVESSGIASRG